MREWVGGLRKNIFHVGDMDIFWNYVFKLYNLILLCDIISLKTLHGELNEITPKQQFIFSNL